MEKEKRVTNSAGISEITYFALLTHREHSSRNFLICRIESGVEINIEGVVRHFRESNYIPGGRPFRAGYSRGKKKITIRSIGSKLRLLSFGLIAVRLKFRASWSDRERG